MLEKLSKREKMMLYILLIVVIFAVGILLLIRPAIDRDTAASDNYIRAKSKTENMKMVIAGKDTAKIEIKDYNRKLKQISRHFQKTIGKSRLDRIVTGIVEKSGMKPQSLVINGGDENSSTSGTSGSSSSNSSGSTSKTSGSGTVSSGTDSTAGSTSGLN